MGLVVERYRIIEDDSNRISGKYFPININGNKYEAVKRFQWSKREIFARDFSRCQISKCRTMSSSQPHHTVSECLASKAKSRIEFGTYTGEQLFVFNLIQQLLPKSKKSKFKEVLGARVIHNNNAITLCDGCHEKLHFGKLRSTKLEPPSVIILRPKTLEMENVMVFFKIMIEETLRDIGEEIYVNGIFKRYIHNLNNLPSYVYY